MTFGDNLRRLRRARGLTQKQLAERIGYCSRNVSVWECGYTTPRMNTLCDLADALGVSLDELTGRDDA